MTDLEISLSQENAKLKLLLAEYVWKDRTETPAPAGVELLLYMNGGTLIKGNSQVIGYTHWTAKPRSPGKQKGNRK